MPTKKTTRGEEIAALNDRFRASLVGAPGIPGRWVMTRGVATLGPALVAEVVRRVQTFATFTPDNDPHGERDFGRFALDDGTAILWKIDYYESAALDYGAEDARTCYRVLVVMLADEY